MELYELIPKEKIVLMGETFSDKMDVLGKLLDFSVRETDLEKNRTQIWKSLMERELSMSTGIGLGVAIPHCSSDYVHDVTGVLALLHQGVDFQAVDDEPVRIIILLLLPKNRFEKHIKTLASIAKMFSDEKFRQSILEAKMPESAWEILRSAVSP